ncbi:hypothetical protein MLD38_029959 [Melastoma candidum]|uniref:Uncharacterized protein n=1 Tax=Melastoma candidum TaxID=119954 RepID=A0ACB9MKD9_9MYRT|nr:hypothetical protein MLD38_029959 [Melastoma candidum]
MLGPKWPQFVPFGSSVCPVQLRERRLGRLPCRYLLPQGVFAFVRSLLPLVKWASSFSVCHLGILIPTSPDEKGYLKTLWKSLFQTETRNQNHQ